MKEKKKIIFDMIHANELNYTLEDFEKDVKKAAQAGATHVMLSPLEKSRWMWEQDLTDPYPNWGMLLLSLFKIIVPDILKGYLPEGYAKRNLSLLTKRMEILKKYQLKAALTLCEPFYLPEAFYRDHPHWRGPRCDHPRRARNTYYSPCIDQPRVLDVYKKTMAQLLSFIDVDYMTIYTNDSGGGLCWSKGLYNGANGPSFCKDRSPADRITGFLGALRQGALMAGKELDIEIHSNIGYKEPEHALDNVWPKLADHTAVNGRTNKGTPMTYRVNLNYENTFSPVKNIPLAFEFAQQLENAYKSDSEHIHLLLPSSDFDAYFHIAKRFIKKPVFGLYDRVVLLRDVATELVGMPYADTLLSVWQSIDRAWWHFIDTHIEGLNICSVNQRWINRPFVLFPHELTEEERGYYRAFQFQANDEKQANDLLNFQCTSFIRGYYAVWIASSILERAGNCIKSAVCELDAIKNDDQSISKSICILKDRLKLLRCFFKNAVHAMKFQDIVDNIDYSEEPEISPRWPIDAQPEFLEYQAITRAEIDNTQEMIELIQGRESKMLFVAPTKEGEDIFVFSPELVSQMKKKIDIMLNHELDGKRVFVTNNK